MIQLTKQKHSHTRFFCLLALLLGLCLVRYSLRIDLPRVLLLAVIITIAVLGDQNEIIAMCICCIPLHESIDFFYSLTFIIAIYAIKFYRHIWINIAIFPILAMILWELLHCLSGTVEIIEFFSKIIQFFPLLLLMCSAGNKFDYELIVRALAVATIVVCLSLLLELLYAADFDYVVAFANLQRLGMATEGTKDSASIVGGKMNPNTLGIVCVLAMTGLMQLRLAHRGRGSDLAMLITMLVFGTLTASRTYLVCLMLMAVLLLLGQKGTVMQKIKFVGILLLVVLVALGLLYLIFPTLMEYYISRFYVDDVTTGRMDLMAVYHEFIMSDPKHLFFGIGLNNFKVKVLEIYRITTHVPHNGIQELIMAWGLPGLVLFIALWVSMAMRSREFNKKQRLINYIPLLVILLKVQAGQMLNSAYTMLAFSFAYLSMCADLTVPEPQSLEETT